MVAVLKHPCMIGGRELAAGTVVRVYDPLDPEVQKVWPGIEKRMSPDAIVVQYPHLGFPLLASKDEFER